MTNTEKLIKFYGTCLEKGYSNMSDDKESLKAKVIATDLGIKYKNIAETYAEAKILYEKDIITKENEAIRQKNEEERRKVDGSLILTVHENESGRGKIITVYRRPDKSIYCCLNGSPRKLEGITISAEKSATIQVKHNPSKLVYTGASSGGITMGGVHATQATYSESAYYTGNGTVQVALEDGTSFIVQKIDVAPAICELFKRDKEFKSFINSSNSIMCYNGLKRSSVEFATKAIMNSSHSYVDKNAMLSTALDDWHLKYSICADISRLINKILSGYNPPSDEELYYSAIRKIKSDNKDELKDAISILTDIADYSDAKEKRIIAQEKLDDIIQIEKENKILAREAAAEKRNKIFNVIKIIGIIVAVLLVAFLIVKIINSTVITPKKQYEQAVINIENKNYNEAISILELLGSYKDSSELLEKVRAELDRETLINANIGDTVYFGSYVQMQRSSDKEKLEWIVLDESDGCILLITKFGIESKAYNTENVGITWDRSPIREWLNTEFLSIAFDEDEIKAIKETNLSNPDNDEFGTPGGEDTVDKVFLLSVDEAHQYFKYVGNRVPITQYVKNLRKDSWYVVISDSEGKADWLLRSPGREPDLVSQVTTYGVTNSANYGHGCGINEQLAIRPAIWIDRNLINN